MARVDELKPNEAEREFLTLAYNRFYDIYGEIISDKFWEKTPWYRLSKIKDAFAVYAELLNYEPIKLAIEQMRHLRPPMEAEISSELFKFIRNVSTHFSFFDSWDEIWVNKQIINWDKEGQSVDKFLKKHEGHKQIKYRFWEADKKKMTYLSKNFLKGYFARERRYKVFYYVNAKNT